jgi:hypothetical protein
MIKAKILNLHHLLGVIGLIGVSMLLGKSILRGDDLMLFGFLSAIVFTIILTDDTVGIAISLVVSFYWIYVGDIFSFPPMFSNLPHLIIIALFLKKATLISLNKTAFLDTPINKASMVLFALILISFVLNNNPLPTALKGMVKQASFILLFFVVVNSNLREASLKTMVGIIVTIGFLQIPASIIQYYYFGFRGDLPVGLLGYHSGDINAVFMTCIFSILFGIIISYGFKLRYGLLSCFLLIPIILGDSRAGLVFFVVTGAFLTALIPTIDYRRGMKTFRVALLIVAMIGIAIYYGAERSQIAFLTNPVEVYTYSIKPLGNKEGMGRLQSIGFVHESIGRSVRSAIIGLGPGSITRTQFLGGKGKFFGKNIDLLRHYNSYAYITIELGYGGFLIFLYMFYRMFSFNKVFCAKVQDKFWKAISIGLSGVIFTFFYSAIYARSWSHPALAFCMWFIAGAISRIDHLNKLVENGGTQLGERRHA